MAKKFYAVKAGRVPGIYDSWDKCKAQITGFSGASYKGFMTLEEAQNFMNPENVSLPQTVDGVPAPEVGCAVAYVDGSFKEGVGRFSYGIVLFINTSGAVEELHLCKAFSNPELLEMRNVAGEIMGAAESMKQAKERSIRQLTIYHDYEGIAKWCTGEWKTNKVWTTKYKAFFDSISKDLTIHFIKVKGHSNDRFNDMADELAKSALNI